jgi:hypothetical protein
MREKDLIELGFLRDEGEWTGSSDDKWYYYTLDIGIDDKGINYLIEINDGWAIGNYGLNPIDYFSFVKARWLQITGILK